jgi:hypothetical protein
VAVYSRVDTTRLSKPRPGGPPITPVAETTIVDVVEKPAPDVITITEFEETDIREAGAGEEPPD